MSLDQEIMEIIPELTKRIYKLEKKVETLEKGLKGSINETCS